MIDINMTLQEVRRIIQNLVKHADNPLIQSILEDSLDPMLEDQAGKSSHNNQLRQSDSYV
jgi:hypothetical protein